MKNKTHHVFYRAYAIKSLHVIYYDLIFLLSCVIDSLVRIKYDGYY